MKTFCYICILAIFIPCCLPKEKQQNQPYVKQIDLDRADQDFTKTFNNFS